MIFGYVTENGVNSNYFAPDLVRINKDGLQMDRKILTYDSVEISFGGKAVVHDVSFSLEHGEILGLVGESGSGKSTLIKAAMGLLGPDGLVTRGDIRYMDQNILDIPEKEKRKIRGAGIGMIFQDAGASLCPIVCTYKDNKK